MDQIRPKPVFLNEKVSMPPLYDDRSLTHVPSKERLRSKSEFAKVGEQTLPPIPQPRNLISYAS